MKGYIVRESGLPIDDDNAEKYKLLWMKYFDAIEAKYKPDMLTVQEKTAKLEGILNRRFENVRKIDVPKSKKAWAELIGRYNSRIALQINYEGKLILVIEDQPEFGS